MRAEAVQQGKETGQGVAAPELADAEDRGRRCLCQEQRPKEVDDEREAGT